MAYWVLSVDSWLQTGAFPGVEPYEYGGAHERTIDMLLDAMDSTLPMISRYAKLGAFVSRGADRTIPQDDVGVFFEDMLRAPILPKSDLTWCATPCQHGGNPAPGPLPLPMSIERHLKPPPDPAESMYRRGVGVRDAWAINLAAMCGYIEKEEEISGLRWAALLENTVVFWGKVAAEESHGNRRNRWSSGRHSDAR